MNTLSLTQPQIFMIKVLAPRKSHLEPDPAPGPSEQKLNFLVPQTHSTLPAPVVMNTAIWKSVPGLPDLVGGVIMIKELLGYTILNCFSAAALVSFFT